MIIQFLFSCKKRDCNRIYTKGSVYDETIHQPVSNATVYLLAQKTGCFTCQPGIITEFKTNGNGEFFIDYEGDSNYSYFMKATKEKYFESETLATLNECSKNYKKDRSLLYLVPEAYLKLHIKNTSNSDELALGSPCSVNCQYYGSNIDTVRTFKIQGNKRSQIIWNVYFNNIHSSFIEEVYCTAFDTTTFNLNY